MRTWILAAFGITLSTFGLLAASGAQKPDLTGTWRLTSPPAEITFERARREPPPPPCNSDDASVRALRFLAEGVAQPGTSFTVTQTESSVLVDNPDLFPKTWYPDGRADAFRVSGVDVPTSARWDGPDGLRFEFDPRSGGKVTEIYRLDDRRALLVVDETIEHPSLLHPSRRTFTYRRQSSAPNPAGSAAGETTASRSQGVGVTVRPPIDHPSFETGKGPLVLVDEAHNNLNTISDRYAAFADVLRRDGYVVKGSQTAFTPDALRDAQVLVIVLARRAPTASEVQAVHNWVVGGGALLLITDHPPLVTPAAELAASFEIRLRNAGAHDPERGDNSLIFRRADGTIRDHPIMRGIDQIKTFSGSSFEIEAGEPLLTFGPSTCSYVNAFDINPIAIRGQLQAAVLVAGLGRVAVFGEAGMLNPQVTESEPEAKQNTALLLNLMRWLNRKL